MGVSDLRAFEILLESEPSESRIDDFFDELNAHPADDSKIFLQSFAKENGSLRNQIQFLSHLYAKGIHIDRCDGSHVAFIFFACSLDPMGTAMARSRLVKINVNCIYLYDNQHMNFAFGVKQCGKIVQQTDAALMQIVDDWKVDRIIAVGHSAAGFAAINRALALNAYASVTFSPFTTFAPEHFERDGRGHAIINRFKKLAPELLIDLVPLLAKREPPLKLVCFYPRGLPKDVWQSERVRGIQDTYPLGINLQTHSVLNPLIEAGTFDILMRPLAEGATLEDSVALILTRFGARSELKNAGQKPT